MNDGVMENYTIKEVRDIHHSNKAIFVCSILNAHTGLLFYR